MAGPYSDQNPPIRSGAYVNWRVQQVNTIDAPLAGVVAVPYTHDWGPINEIVEYDSLAEWRGINGPSTDTPGYRAVYQAFKGEGVENKGGAARVVGYRAAGSSAAKATKALGNTTPATPALTLSARYEGTRGNDLRAAVVANPDSPSTKNDLVIYDGLQEIERYDHLKADISELAAEINTYSDWATAVANIDNVALALVAAANFTGGDDGSTLIAGDWTDIIAAYGDRRFNVFVPYDLQDDSIIASLKTWLDGDGTGLNDSGQRCFLLVGGTLTGTDDMSDALDRADDMNSENVAVFGGVVASDSGIVDANGDEVTLTSSQLAPRIAGVMMARGESSSLSLARLAGLTLISGPNDNEIKQAIQGGVITVAKDSNRLAPVRIERGVTSYQSDTTDKPKEIFGEVTFVLTMHALEMELVDFAENNVIGRLHVNNATREYLVGQMNILLRRRVEAGIIQRNPVVRINNDPPPSDQDNFISLLYELKFGRNLEQIRNTVVVG